jgi:predicted O-linked N-acetylglucosamine transferase (SPINDLY family)
MDLDRPEAALASYDRYLILRPNVASGYAQRAAAAARLGCWEDALASYDRAVTLDPQLADAFCNRGNVLQELGRWGEALASYDRAIHLVPDLSQAHYNRGNLLRMVRKPEAALASYQRALTLRPDYVPALHNRANTLLDLGRIEAAIEDYERVRELGGVPFLPGALRFARMQLCDWTDLEEELAELASAVQRGERVAPPFPLLALLDCPELHRKAAGIWSRHRRSTLAGLPPIPLRPRRARIRIGYFSADLHEHPVARLIVGLLETHDRSRFEVVVFSSGPELKDPLRERIRVAADQFVDVRKRSERDIALLARELGIDVAIDLGGYTQGSRPGVFLLRAAPVQMSYLGYLGTQGDFIDYLIADRIIIPAASRLHYAEKIVYLPCYQVNDPTRPLPGPAPSREALGVPTQAFLYCCFNASYKITPASFGSWMRILARVPDSVLLLYVERPAAAANLRRNAEVAGIDPRRVLFAPRLGIPEYLARLRVADLFLDTLPYNAGTTASDALWSGLPVLTCAGESFASRMAASLLHSVGLPQLITTTTGAFEDLAVELAANADLLAALRRKLEDERSRAQLFDARKFARCFEAACIQAYERYCSGLAPEDIVV